MDAAGLIAWSATGNPRKIRYAYGGDAPPGRLPQDVWTYKDPQRAVYPTQKNADMLRRIILTSSNPGDTVLDCYAGSGGALLAAHQLGRGFVGMDASESARRVIERRLAEAGVVAEPVSRAVELVS